MTARQHQLVRRFSRELDEDVKRELATALRGILENEEEEGREEQHLDLEEVGIRVQAHPRGPGRFLYTVSQVLLPEARDFTREGDVLLKAGDDVVTSLSPGELRQYCQTQLTSSCVRLIFGPKDALTNHESREVEYVAIKVGYETEEKCEEVACLGSSRPGCLTCSQRLLLKPQDHHRSVVKVEGKDTYLEPDPRDRILRTSRSPCQRPQKFSRHTGFLELRDTIVCVTTLETEVKGRRLALRYGDPQGNIPSRLWLESPPALPDWPFLQYGNNRTWVRHEGCPFLFRMEQSESNNLLELRPLHHAEFLLCLDEDGVLVLRREGEEPIFDIQDVPASPPSSPEPPEPVRSTRRLHSFPAMLDPAGPADNVMPDPAGPPDNVMLDPTGPPDNVMLDAAGPPDTDTAPYGFGVNLGTWDDPGPSNSSTAHGPWDSHLAPLHQLLTAISLRHRSNSD